MDTLDYKLQLFKTRKQLNIKGVSQPVRIMINKGLWTKTKQDSNYLLGRVINEEFLTALKKLEKTT